MIAAPRALITGIDGFTGRYLAAELRQAGYRLHGLGLAPSPAADVESHVADLCDAKAVAAAVAAARPDVVVHLAAIAFVAHGDPADFYRTHILGTRNLLAALDAAQAAKHIRPRCILLASSANVYGNAREGLLDEDTPPAPANDYAVSKLAMEYMARLWQDRLPIVRVRPFNYTGLGQSVEFLIPKLVDHFRRRAPRIRLGNLDVARDFSDVRAVVEAYRRLLETPAAIGAVINICSGRTQRLRAILAHLETLSGHRPAIDIDPALVRAHEVRTLGGNPARLRQYIGAWESPPLTSTLAWMLHAQTPDGAASPCA